MEEEPYTVQEIRNKGEVKWLLNEVSEYPMMISAPPGLHRFHVFYRSYAKQSWFSVHARDELEAFMKATKQLAKNKAKADKRRAKRANQGATS